MIYAMQARQQMPTIKLRGLEDAGIRLWLWMNAIQLVSSFIKRLVSITLTCRLYRGKF